MDLYDLGLGKVVNKRWYVQSQLGEGSCGVVYRVYDVQNPKFKAALKVEAITEENVTILKKEAIVLKELRLRKFVPQLIYSGRRENYSYIVLSLYGKNLNQLKKDKNLEKLSAGCAAKIGVHVLYAIKQVHEIGYVHRDVKPSNIVVGRHGMEKRMMFLIDYGEYCSLDVHLKKEQGRKDDLWSLMYLLIELRDELPWTGKAEPETGKMKAEIKDEILLKNCPNSWLEIVKHLHGLSYESRPNYLLIYDKLVQSMLANKTTFDAPYDWEQSTDTKPSESSVNSTRKTDKAKNKTPSTSLDIQPPSFDLTPRPDTSQPSTIPTTDPSNFSSCDIGI
ncbi:Protein kinase domain-containing protein [Aphelenchoides besseyi]|nr:Protein kinase domain-containing protein [Aphelenchoides besseyi]KAI6194314.1 Protein kinase domain-containing protein [Aphelenchoides besseyi]